jgi:NADH:ubiquinone oxidoreductase subunit 2 (subunit N)
VTSFRIFLVLIWLGLTGYTIPVVANHGIDLLSVFVRDMVALDWPGQFNLDFLLMLLLSALWVAWRNGFSPSGLALAVAAFLGGSLFLSTYLLILTFTTNGTINQVLVGEKRTARE